MGKVFELDVETGEHVSTGKHPHPAGVRHAPVWGEPMLEGPGWESACVADEACDQVAWRPMRDGER